jgi:hypothetical protein
MYKFTPTSNRTNPIQFKNGHQENYWAFPGHGPGRVLLAKHARLIEPLARLALDAADVKS